MKWIKLFGVVLFTLVMSVVCGAPVIVAIRGFDTALTKGIAMILTFLAILVILLLVRRKIIKKKHLIKSNLSPLFVIVMVVLSLALQMLLDMLFQYFGLEMNKSNTTAIVNLLRTDDYWLMILATSLVAPILEEITFRGILLESLIQTFPKAGHLNVVISSFIFAFLHIFSLNIIIINYFISAYLFGYLYSKTRDLRYSIFAHALTNSLITVIYYAYLFIDKIG